MLITSSPAAVGVFQFNMNYIPQFFTWDDPVAVTGIRVEDQTLGVLCDLDQNGLAACTQFMAFGDGVAGRPRQLRLANGHMTGRNVTVTITQGAAAAVNFFGASDNAGVDQAPVAFKYQRAAILAGSPLEFRDFSALFLPGMVAGDNVLVTYDNGHQQTYTGAELLTLAQAYQRSQAAGAICINNVNSYVRRATVTQGLAGTAYIMKVNL